MTKDVQPNQDDQRPNFGGFAHRGENVKGNFERLYSEMPEGKSELRGGIRIAHGDDPIL